ncbi:Tas retrotransposon peptidase A16, partial [Oesophagostomum dentatum]
AVLGKQSRRKALQDARRLVAQLDQQLEAGETLLQEVHDKLSASHNTDANSDNVTLVDPSSNLSSFQHNANINSNILGTSSLPSAIGQQAVEVSRIELPSFSGNQSEFYEFWAMFKTAVHDNPTLSPAAKFLYLSSCLKDSAAIIIQAFDLTEPSNYQLAVEALLKRFDRPEFTHNFYLQKLQNIRVSDPNASSQRATLCQIQAYIQQIERFENVTQSLVLKNTIRQKFPKDTQLEIAKLESQSGTTWSLHQLLDGLDDYVKELESIDDCTFFLCTSEVAKEPSVAQNVDARPTTPLPPYDPDLVVLPLIVVDVEDSTIRSSVLVIRYHVRTVAIVPLVHMSLEPTITRLLVVVPRRVSLRDIHTFDSYYRPSAHDYEDSPSRHRSYDRGCRSSTRYNSPSPDRPSRLSPDVSSRTRLSHSSNRTFPLSPQRSRSVDSKSNLPRSILRRPKDATSTQTEYQTLMDCYASAKQLQAYAALAPFQSILMIVQARVRHGRTRELEPVYIFLDSGAQISFISNSAVCRLCLNPVDVRSLTARVFGGHKMQQNSGIVELDLIDSANERLHVCLHSSDKTPAARLPPRLHLEDLAALRSADIDPESLLITQYVEPDILLGMDYYWQVFLDEPPTVLPSGLVLTHTRFGITLSGQS